MKNLHPTILHVTPEINDYITGGIGILCNELQKTKEFKFCFVTKDETKLIYEDNIISFLRDENLFSNINSLKFDKIIFHDYFLLSLYSINNTLNGNEYLVIHSNPIMESKFISRYFNNERIYWFDYVVSLPNIKIIVVSNSEKEILLQQYPNLNSTHVSVIYNGINFENCIEYSSIKNGRFGFIGRLDERKGIIKLIHDFKYTCPNEELYVATGGFNKYMHEMAEKLVAIIPRFCNIKLVGWCQGERKKSFFNSIDALIIPSYYEPFGLIILESFFYGKPVICTKIGGMVEILGEDYPFFYNPIDDQSLKDTIIKFKNYKNLDKLVSNLQIKFNIDYSNKNMADIYKYI